MGLTVNSGLRRPKRKNWKIGKMENWETRENWEIGKRGKRGIGKLEEWANKNVSQFPDFTILTVPRFRMSNPAPEHAPGWQAGPNPSGFGNVIGVSR